MEAHGSIPTCTLRPSVIFRSLFLNPIRRMLSFACIGALSFFFVFCFFLSREVSFRSSRHYSRLDGTFTSVL